MTRRERITFLLENYMEVEQGLQEPKSGPGDFIPQMCRAYRHPSYVELRRVLLILQSTEPVIWWDLAETYFRFQERRVAWCSHCGGEYPTRFEESLHRHGRKLVKLIPRVVRRRSLAIRPENVNTAIDWLTDNFHGEPFIPDELLVYVAA